MSTSKTQESNYLIIGGTTRSATTSLFYYLADHPEVCVSTMKETRFFIDQDYPVMPLSFTYFDGLEKYENFFKTCSKEKHLRVESSPEYLYSSGTPQRIRTSLPNAKLVFLLREPISRNISWYQYAQQKAQIPKEMTFSEYIERQLQGGNFDRAKHYTQASQRRDDYIPQDYFLSALEHGRYSTYLRPYFEVFGRENIHIIFYDDLKNNTKFVLEKLCKFAEIEPKFYTDYNFQIFNKVENIKNSALHGAYGQLRSRIRKYTHSLYIHKMLRQMRRWMDPIYYLLNTDASEKIVLSPGIESTLRDYYRLESTALEELLNYSVPWSKDLELSMNSTVQLNS